MKAAVASSVLIGFISLSYEIVWFRAFSFTTGGSPAVFGFLLAAFLGGTAFGSLAGWALISRSNVAGNRGPVRALGFFVAAANLIAFGVLPLLSRIVVVTHWSIVLPVVALATTAWGAAMPILAQFAVPPDGSAGAGVSRLYAANIAGSVAGTLLTGFVLLEWLTLSQTAVSLAICGQILSIALLRIGRCSSSGNRYATAVLIAAGALFAIATPLLFDSFYERLQLKRTFANGYHFARVVENRSGVITVTRQHEVFGGGAYDGIISTSLTDDRNLIERAYAIAGFHPSPKRVLMIGLSTGAWAQVIANMPGVEQLTVIEINPGYLGLISQYPEVASLLRNQKVDVVIDDGRRWMMRHPDEQFDVIVANTTLHWRAHSTNLLSREYLEICRRHLVRGGVLHYNTTWSDEAMATGLRTFPYGYRYMNFVTVSDSPFAWNEENFRSAVSNLSIDSRPVVDLSRDSDRAVLDRVATLAPYPEMELVPVIESRSSALQRLARSRTVTDDNMVTEWRHALVHRMLN